MVFIKGLLHINKNGVFINASQLLKCKRIEYDMPIKLITMNKLDLQLRRRGIDLGVVEVAAGQGNAEPVTSLSIDIEFLQTAWQQGNALFLSGLCLSDLESHEGAIKDAYLLYESILTANEQCDSLLDQEPYASRLLVSFESLGSSMNEGDDQEIETVFFDAINQQGDVLAEDLWMKVSWLSFHDEDTSLRFRFSFGVDLHEDVAADIHRQHYAALLTEAIFPESTIITKNHTLYDILTKVVGVNDIHFVERIIYFNSPNGGAYLHHDRERGHAGVVFAQLSGQTFWLAISKNQLIQEIDVFVQSCITTQFWPSSIDKSIQQELLELSKDHQLCSEQLESFANNGLIQLINETEMFVQQLISKGYGHHLCAGDVLLLPQETEANCCWHSVFCIGKTTGQALSFAIRSSE